MSSRRPKTAVERDRYTAELSTGQLVIGVCILLMFGLGCFLLGVLIGKFDPTNRDEMTTAGLSETPELQGAGATPPPLTPDRTPNRPSENGLRPEDRPPPNLIEQPANQPAEGPTKVAASAEGSAVPNTASTDLPPPGDGATTPSAGAPDRMVVVTAPQVPPAQVAPTGTTSDAPAPSVPAPAENKPAETKAPEPKPAPAAVSSSGLVYGVQIIAVARPRAEAVKRDIEARSSYKAEIIPIDGDRLCKVVVGRFGDKPAAERTRDEIRSKFPFKDAFVIVL